MQAKMSPSHTCNSLPDRYAVVKCLLLLNHVIMARSMCEIHWIQKYKCSLNTIMKSKCKSLQHTKWPYVWLEPIWNVCKKLRTHVIWSAHNLRNNKKGQQRVYFILDKPSDTDNKVCSMKMQMRSVSFPEQEMLTEEARSSFASILANPKSPARSQYGQCEASW